MAWIKCSERLPEPNVSVLVFQGAFRNRDGTVEPPAIVTDQLADDGKWSDADWITTHWQPLPEPPDTGA